MPGAPQLPGRSISQSCCTCSGGQIFLLTGGHCIRGCLASFVSSQPHRLLQDSLQGLSQVGTDAKSLSWQQLKQQRDKLRQYQKRVTQQLERERALARQLLRDGRKE